MIDLFGKVDAILFHHGEADNRRDAAAASRYKSDLRDMLLALQAAGIQSPVYISQASICVSASDALLLRAQAEIPTELVNARPGPNTDSPGMLYGYDGCHFYESWKYRLAELWYESLFGSKNQIKTTRLR